MSVAVYDCDPNDIVGPFNSDPGSSGKVISFLTIRNVGPSELWVARSASDAVPNGSNAVSISVGETLNVSCEYSDDYYGACGASGTKVWVSKAQLDAS